MADIFVHGLPVPVHLVDGRLLQHQAMDENVIGHFNCDDGIQIRKELPPGSRIGTLIHEATHAAFPGMSEADVIAIERWLPSFIIDNGGSMDWAQSIIEEAQSEFESEGAEE